MNLLSRHRTFILLYGSVFLYFMWPLIFLQKTFIFGDYWQQHYPWAYEYARVLKTGSLPYWVPQVANGFPLVAEGQVGTYYLPHLLMYGLLPFFAAYTWGIVLHVLAGGVGSYVYGQRTGLTKEASALFALLFSFSSAYGGCFSNTAVLRVMAWLPWCLFAWDALCAASGRKRFSWMILLGFFFSQMATAGAPQMALYAGIYLLLLCLLQSRGRHWGGLLAAGAIGALLSLPQWAATLELLPLSARAGETASFALSGSVLPPSLVSLAFPEWGTFLGLSFYLGAIPLCLLFISLTSKKSRSEKIHLWLALLFALMAFGKYNPIYAWLVEKGSFTALRSPSKWLFFSVVSLSAIAACAFDRLVQLSQDLKFSRGFRKGLLAASAFLVCAPGLAQVAYAALKRPLAEFARQSAEAVYAGKADPWHDVVYYQERGAEIFARLERLFSYSNPWNLAAIVFFLLSAFVFWKILSKNSSGLWKRVAIPVLLAVDLAFFGTFLGTGFTGNARTYPKKLSETVVAEMRQRQSADHSAVIGWTDEENQEALPANVNLLYGINHAGGYSPLLMKRYYELTKELGIVDSSLGRRPYSEEIWKRESGLVRAIGISQVLTKSGLRDTEGALPFAWMVSDWKVIPDERERLVFLKSGQFRPSEMGILETPPAYEPAPGASAGSARILSKTQTEASLDVRSASNSLLVLRSVFYPRWRAEVDGQPTPVFPVDHALSGVFLKKGEHRVRFYYDAGPQHLYEGISLVALLWLVVYALRLKRVQ